MFPASSFILLQGLIVEREYCPDWEAALLGVLRHGEQRFCRLLETLGRELGLELGEATRRAAAGYAYYCVGDLADDMMDGDADWIEPRAQPIALVAFCELADLILASSTVDALVRAEVSRSLLWATHAQYQECSIREDRELTFGEYQQIAVGVTAKPVEGFFRIVASGTTAEEELAAIAIPYGVVAHVAGDLRDSDPRLVCHKSYEAILDWARKQANVILGRCDFVVIRRRVQNGLEMIESAMSNLQQDSLAQAGVPE